ncbi:integrase [Bacillus sp. V5-8f]|nr:integrase [Bacillus sp. V5-8f]
MTLKEMHLQFMRFKRVEGLAPRTLDDYENHFGYLCDYIGGDLNKSEMTAEVFLDYKDYMLNERGFSPHTVNVRVRTLHSFLKYCYEEGFIVDQLHKKIKTVKAPIDNVESLTPMELKQIFSVIDEDWYTGFRDKVLLLVMLDSMARIGELVKATRNNVDLKHGAIYLGADTVKTRQGRTVPLSYKTTKMLSEYIDETAEYNTTTLFVTYDGSPISDNTVRKRFKDYAHKAGITKQVSPHVFRHTGALLYLMNGGDPFSLQKILGHKDMTMTRRYVQMSNSDVKSQHEAFSPINSIFNK